jgi:hypothetical protein
MRILKLHTFCYILKINEHEEFKQYMLSYISKQPSNTLVELEDNITNTDWKNSHDRNREYVQKFYEVLRPYLSKLTIEIPAKNYQINNMWYQQYAKNSKHEWHRHIETNWSAVYFLELPDSSVATQFFETENNKTLHEKNIEEGDLLIFPANMLHRSPENLTNKIKSIISFNLYFK